MTRRLTIHRQIPTQEIPPLFPIGDKRKSIDLYELTELSGIAVTTLRSWVRQGKIGGAFQAEKNGKWRFRRELLEKWWEELLSRQMAGR
jgi:helix-turn-helix protein